MYGDLSDPARPRPSLAGRACRSAGRVAVHATFGLLGYVWVRGLSLSVQALVWLSPDRIDRYSERYLVSPLHPVPAADNDRGMPNRQSADPPRPGPRPVPPRPDTPTADGPRPLLI